LNAVFVTSGTRTRVSAAAVLILSFIVGALAEAQPRGHSCSARDAPVVFTEAATAAIGTCGPRANRLARFVARTHRWRTPRPRVQFKGTLGSGAVWHAYDEPACCGQLACGGSSEQADALVGSVGRRLFALTANRPTTTAVPAGSNRLVAPFRPEAWNEFLRAAGATPCSPGEALSLAWLVYVSAYPGQGLVMSPDEASLTVMEGQRRRFATVTAEAQQLFGEPIRSRAVRTDHGFDVIFYTSRHVWFRTLRITPAGSSSDESMRRIRVRVSSEGEMEFTEDIPVRSGVQTGAAPPATPLQ